MINIMNKYGALRVPFLFIIDFEKKNPIIIPIEEINSKNILYNINGISNTQKKTFPADNIIKKKYPIDYSTYRKKFNIVLKNLKDGNSYLVNLTYPTEIEFDLSLEEIFYMSSAKYKLFYNNQFTLFSPETFIKIKNNKIYSFPMKGTINADIKNAEKIIMEDKKELAEHVTIVDLIRNDLNIISRNIKVEKFRYVDKIYTNENNLLQISSIITGELENNYNEHIGNIIDALLPAGSITGAPKKKTIEIIKKAENYDRGYYTGIFGYFDGYNLDSGVMIRFIEKVKDKFFYKSGGGITIYSDPESEYQELLEKIYVPID
jgi:para-aminobenzoate synthetase component I